MNVAASKDMQSARRSLKEFAIHVLSSNAPLQLPVDARTAAALFLIAERRHTDMEALIMRWIEDRLRDEEARELKGLDGFLDTYSSRQAVP